DVDPSDPGYSFINRGTISAQPTDPDRSSTSVVIQGASPTYFTCLSSLANGTCSTALQDRTDNVTSTVNGVTTTTPVSYRAGCGLLNTGTMSAVATTNSQTVTANGVTTATAMFIGGFTTIPRLDLKSEAINSGSNTPARIVAQVSGIGS